MDLNDEMQYKLKQDIEAKMPFISELQETTTVMVEYVDTKFEKSFE